MALHAVDRQHAVQRAAPAVLDRVAEPLDDVGSPTMQASMRSPRDCSTSTTAAVPSTRVAFLVRREQQRDRAAMIRAGG